MRATYQGRVGPFGYRLTPWVKRLMIANTVIFVLMWSIPAAGPWLVDNLGFTASEAWRMPWTIVTYMFVHGGFFHIFFNMLMLFFFGPPLEERWGGREFIKYYAICGIGGAILTLIFEIGSIGADIPVVGASAAIYGVMLAYALNWPDTQIWIYAIFPIKAKYLVLILGAISFFSAFAGSADGIAHFAHLGGLVAGYSYLKLGWKVETRLAGLKKDFKRRRLKVVPGGSETRKGGKPQARPSEGDEEARILEVVDALLDKIAESGLESLTAEERKFLDDVSRRRQESHEVRH